MRIPIVLFISALLLSACIHNEPAQRQTYDSESQQKGDSHTISTENIARIDAESIALFSALMAHNGMKQNIILSPLSLQRVFGLIASGTSERQALSKLRLYDSCQLSTMRLTNTQAASRVLINAELRPSSVSGEGLYDDIAFVQFPHEATKQKMDLQREVLREVLDTQELSQDTSIALLDAVRYFSEWLLPFQEDATKERPFSAASGERLSVPTMHAYYKDSSALVDDEKEIFALEAKEGAKVFFIKPTHDADKAVSKLQTYIMELYEKGVSADVDFYLPKVNIKSDLDLTKLLGHIGYGALLQGFEFDKLMPHIPLRVSSARQVATLRIDEKGAEAKAITSFIAKTAFVPQDLVVKYEIKMDSPYFIVVSDTEEHTRENIIVFTAYIANPLE